MSGVLIATVSGAVVEANEEACALFGRAKSELEGMLFGDLFPSPYRVSMRSKFTAHGLNALQELYRSRNFREQSLLCSIVESKVCVCFRGF